MKKIIIGVLLVASFYFTGSHQVSALTFPWENVKVEIPSLPTVTPTPTKVIIKVIKDILPIKEIMPLATSTKVPTAVPTVAPTAEPTVVNTVAPTANPTAVPTEKLVATVGPTVATEVASVAAETKDDKTQMFLIVTVGLLGLIVLVQAWPKIRSWLHDRTQ